MPVQYRSYFPVPAHIKFVGVNNKLYGMLQTDEPKPLTRAQHTDDLNPFIPRGAITFFVLLLLLCGAIWFGIYYIMLQRA